MPRGKKSKPSPTHEPEPKPDLKGSMNRFMGWIENPKNRNRTAFIVVAVFILLIVLKYAF